MREIATKRLKNCKRPFVILNINIRSLLHINITHESQILDKYLRKRLGGETPTFLDKHQFPHFEHFLVKFKSKYLHEDLSYESTKGIKSI